VRRFSSFNFLMPPRNRLSLVWLRARWPIIEGGIAAMIDTRSTRRPLDLKMPEAFDRPGAPTTRMPGEGLTNGPVSWRNEDRTFGVLAAGICEAHIRQTLSSALGYFDSDPGPPAPMPSPDRFGLSPGASPPGRGRVRRLETDMSIWR
jgi:hypothetical protein